MVAQATLLLFGSFFVMLLVGVPISAGIGIASIFTALFSMDPAIFALTAAQRCFSGIDSFSLLALPFFSLGGNIMNKGGIAQLDWTGPRRERCRSGAGSGRRPPWR